MNKPFFKVLLFICFLALFTNCDKKKPGKPKVLVFSKTMGYTHPSIPSGIEAIQKLGNENGFVVDTTTNGVLFNDDNLKQYASIIFLNTTLNVLNHYEEAAFERYIQSGGGFVGVHAAADTEYDWSWYTKLVGAQFLNHPKGTPNANFVIKDNSFIATEHFTDSIWNRSDELYNYKNINPDVHVLMTVDESTYEGGENGEFHPIAWYHEFDGGRAFYTGAGHTDESYKDEMFLKHLLRDITYANGKNLELDYKKATTQIPPETDRFSKVMLTEGELFEPTEMTILPNSDVLIAQRRGEILLYKESTKQLSEVAKLDVYHKTLKAVDVNAEEGLMGLQRDPNFKTNNWVYVFYAPTGDAQVNRLSRFKFKDDVFDMESEQVILDVASQREICCHTGGSIAFGPDNLLYLSTGDNSTPFDEKEVTYVNNGFAPLNDIPGHEQYDALRSSGNTNDLRGKILRIKVNEDGSYDIPEGNLFPKGTEKTRPEIYTMGHRNPYRISVDQKNSYVYWGDVGPDSRVDSLATRGPRGYDELNQARKAGNFGWPLFIGDNKPYVAYDYENGTSGDVFNPEQPINNSRNNTGLKELPEAMPAYVYYPYSKSTDFPQVGSGGRNAMAGPTYYSDLYSGTDKLPAYYDGKVIVYEWMRGWMMAIHLNEDGSLGKMEPFASDIQLNSLIDMEVGPDGKIYLLEYGSGWFSKNEDSALSYIKFNGGNRAPLIDNVLVDHTSGIVPLEITAKANAQDREGDTMTYVWDLGNGETKETSTPELSYTYKEKGSYKLSVQVKDSYGEIAKSKSTLITAGNSRPEITIDLVSGNTSFFLPGHKISYEVSVNDPDGNETIQEENIFVSIDYLEGMDKVAMSLGHQQVSATVTGKALTQSLDCKACHKESEPSIGPNYIDISNKYKDQPNALKYLQEKMVSGGSGVWGEVMMPAHPNLTTDESRQIGLYIESLAADEDKSLPAKGTVTTIAKPRHVMVITASYTDDGLEGAPPLTGANSLVLSSNIVPFPVDAKTEGMDVVRFGKRDLQLMNATKGGILLEDIDLEEIKTIGLALRWREPNKSTYNFKIHLNNSNGPIIGEGVIQSESGNARGVGIIPINTENKGKTNIYISYTTEKGVANPGTATLFNATFK